MGNGGKGRDARKRGGKERGKRKERRGREGEGRKVRTPPPSIPAYAPGRMVPSLTTGHTDQP